jgi:hypothetical protein
VIVNGDVEKSVAQVQAIVTAEKLRRNRQLGFATSSIACATG